MKDGILLCEGKGNHDWNYSSAHGAGRVLTRQQAKNKEMFDKLIEEGAKELKELPKGKQFEGIF